MPLFWKLLERHAAREDAKNLRAGLIAATLCNVNRSKSTDKVWSAFDFFPRKEETQSEDEMLINMDAWVARTRKAS